MLVLVKKWVFVETWDGTITYGDESWGGSQGRSAHFFVPLIFRDEDDPFFWFRGGISLLRDLWLPSREDQKSPSQVGCLASEEEGKGKVAFLAVLFLQILQGYLRWVAVENPTTQRSRRLQAHFCIWCATVAFIFHCKNFPQTQTVRGKVSCQQDSLAG